MDAAAWLIKTNMPVASYPQYLQIYATKGLNFFFIFEAVLPQFFLRYCAIGQMIVGGVNVSLFKKILSHEVMVALQCVFVHWIILIQVKGYDIFKTQAF